MKFEKLTDDYCYYGSQQLEITDTFNDNNNNINMKNNNEDQDEFSSEFIRKFFYNCDEWICDTFELDK